MNDFGGSKWTELEGHLDSTDHHHLALEVIAGVAIALAIVALVFSIIAIFICLPADAAEIVVSESEWIVGRRALNAANYAGVSVTRGYAPHPVFFEGYAENRDERVDPARRFDWDFGDGSAAFEGFNAAHVYARPGVYDATLTVDGATARQRVEVLAPLRTFYVRSDGSDAADGLSEGTAWRTAGHAFRGITDGRYRPGDRVLFRRGEDFDVTATVGFKHWTSGYGYSFGAYGEGSRPVIQWAGGAANALFGNTAVGLAHVAFVDLDFELESAAGNRVMGYYASGSTQYMTFLRCRFSPSQQGIVFSGGASDQHGVFVVGCEFGPSNVTQISATCRRLALLDNEAWESGNHTAYLAVVDQGVISGNRWRHQAFGRVSLRVSGAGWPDVVTRRVLVQDNEFAGWIDPVSVGASHAGVNGNRYNLTMVQIGDNTGNSLQTIRDVVFRRNEVRDGENLIQMTSCENAHVLDNALSSVSRNPGWAIQVGSASPTWGLRPCAGVYIQGNDVEIVGQMQEFKLWPYAGPAFGDLTDHEDVVYNSVGVEGMDEDPLPEPEAEVEAEPEPGIAPLQEYLVTFTTGETTVSGVLTLTPLQ